MWKLKLASLTIAFLLLMSALPVAGGDVASRRARSPHVARVGALVRSLTEPEHGPSPIPVTRWVEDVVRVHVSLPSAWPASYRAVVPKALRWVSRQSGVEFVLSDDPNAPVNVWAGSWKLGSTTFYRNADSTLRHIEVNVGCCRKRVMWEELAQIGGIVGDGAPVGADSVFSNSSTSTRPSKLDGWIVRTLYTIPPGTTAAELRTRFGGATVSSATPSTY